MSKIRGKNTLLELSGFEILKKTSVRFRKHPKKVFGNPDAALKLYKIAIFFDSDFWHGFDYENSLKQRLPNDYWVRRIFRNVQRDNEVTSKLTSEGWAVMRFWEHEIEKKPDDCIRRVVKVLKIVNAIK